MSVSAGSRQQVVTGLTSGTSYYFKLRAVGPSGYGAFSRVRTISLPSARVQPASGFSYAVDGNNIKLTWEASSRSGLKGDWFISLAFLYLYLMN